MGVVTGYLPPAPVPDRPGSRIIMAGEDYGLVPDDYTKASQNLAGLQAAFDDAAVGTTRYKRASLRLRAETYYINGTIYVNGEGLTVESEGGAGQIQGRYVSGPLMAVSLPLSVPSVAGAWADLFGLVDTSVAAASGVAYGADLSKSTVVFRSTVLDLGPPSNPQSVPTWFQVEQQYTISFLLIPTATGSRDGQFASFAGFNLALSGGGTLVTLSLTTSDAKVRNFTFPVTMTTNVPTKCAIVIDLANAAVAAYVGQGIGSANPATAVAVNSYDCNLGWVPGNSLRMAEPLWREGKIGGAIGYILGGFKLSTSLLYSATPTVGDSVGSGADNIYGKPLPADQFALTPAPTAMEKHYVWSGRSAYANPSGAGVLLKPDYVANASTYYLTHDFLVRNLSLFCYGGYGQGIMHAGILSSGFENLFLTGGANGIAGVEATNSYPYWIDNCHFINQSHSGLHLTQGLHDIQGATFTTIGRYGITAYSSFRMRKFFTGEGAATKAVIRGFGLSGDGSDIDIADGNIDFEQYTPGRQILLSSSRAGRDHFAAHNVILTDTQPGEGVIQVLTPPVMPLETNGLPRPYEVVLSGRVGGFANDDAAGLVSVSGTQVRVRSSGPYINNFPLAANTAQGGATWAGFEPGSEPINPAHGGTLPQSPPVWAEPAGYTDLGAIPNLIGRYRAGFQGLANGSPGPDTLLDETTGSGRTAHNLTWVNYQSSVKPTIVDGGGGLQAIRFIPSLTSFYWYTPGLGETTQGATVFAVGRGIRYAFRGDVATGLWLDDVARVGAYLLKSTINPRSFMAVHALRYDPATKALSWFINGRLNATAAVLNPAHYGDYKIDKFIIGGPPDQTVDIYEVLPVLGPMADGDVIGYSRKLMHDNAVLGG